MELKDQDFYREGYKKHNLKNACDHPLALKLSQDGFLRKSGVYGAVSKFFLYPLFALTMLGTGTNVFADDSGGATTLQTIPNRATYANLASAGAIPGGIVLQTDQSGHFRGTALLNNVPVPFIIDTGATQTVIPASMATAARLPFGRTVPTKTAGGQVLDHLTQIKSLKIGNAEIKKLDARINKHLNEVLIGMNTLKYFHMTQNGNTLTLAYAKPEGMAGAKLGAPAVSSIQVAEKPGYGEPPESAAADQPDKKAKSTWKKTVTCDGQNNCKTVYGDH